MRGLMMDEPLGLVPVLRRASALFADREVRTLLPGGGVDRRGWREVETRARRLAAALAGRGVEAGDRVASLAWNTHRHLELYFAVPCSGRVLLTLNVRLLEGTLGGILEQAGARVLFVDAGAAGRVPEILEASGAPVELVVTVDGDSSSGADGEPAGIETVGYEALLDEAEPLDEWPVPHEDAAAALCFTSGTTGRPKGVAYSHRALALHTLAVALPDAFDLAEADTILPAVPMFHANAWGLPFAAAMVGADLVLPGRRPSPSDLARLLEGEEVTFAAGVPTVWMDVLTELRSRPRDLSRLRAIHVGGAPTPPGLLRSWERELGVRIVPGWGMTELSPVGLVNRPRRGARGPADDAPADPGAPDGEGRASDLPPPPERRTHQGRPLPFVEIRVVDGDGRPLPWDGESAGELQVRGPWVASGYLDGENGVLDEGWLRTGDVATVDPDGYVRIVDRTKDLVRSGGEWISSLELENALMNDPRVAEAAVIAVPHPRWQERPLACVVAAGEVGGVESVGTALLETLRGRVPDWWIPDRVVFVERIPRTATGKFDKRALRARFATPAGAPPDSS